MKDPSYTPETKTIFNPLEARTWVERVCPSASILLRRSSGREDYNPGMINTSRLSFLAQDLSWRRQHLPTWNSVRLDCCTLKLCVCTVSFSIMPPIKLTNVWQTSATFIRISFFVEFGSTSSPFSKLKKPGVPNFNQSSVSSALLLGDTHPITVDASHDSCSHYRHELPNLVWLSLDVLAPDLTPCKPSAPAP
jgi:hypothetical protein